MRHQVLCINDQRCTDECGCNEDRDNLFVFFVFFYGNIWYLKCGRL